MSLLVITPSRGRPKRFRDLAIAVEALSTDPGTYLVAGFDKDDPCLDEYLEMIEGSDFTRLIFRVGPRDTLSGWTNTLTDAHKSWARYVASFGDDHLPRTLGWDSKLMKAIEDMGGTGISYGDDLAMGERLPTAPVVSVNIVEKLGWFTYPKCGHYCVDNVWKDLGRGAGCLRYVPEVVVEHLHHTTGKAPADATYADAGGFTPAHPDYAAYQNWLAHRAVTDIAAVKELTVVSR